MKKIILWWGRAAIVALFLFASSCKSVQRTVDREDSTTVEVTDTEVKTGRSFYDSTRIYKKDDFKVTFVLNSDLYLPIYNGDAVDHDLLRLLVERAKEVTISGTTLLQQQNQISETTDSVYTDKTETVVVESKVKRNVERKQSFLASIGFVLIVFVVILIVLAILKHKFNGIIKF